MTDSQTDLPRVGMIATVRNRRGLIASVEPFDTHDGCLHLVRVEYTDSDGQHEDRLIWEREHNRRLLEPTALPRVGEEGPMPPRELDALVRATRWTALSPLVSPDGSGTAISPPISSPFFGAVQVEDFQLLPLLKALQMPRVSLLLADDVGLGKTIEAGLVLTELLLRRRIRRVLVLTPASLRRQWQQEMKEKFSLPFDLVDRDETHALQSRLGLDANPWRTFPRIIASYYYLRQPDVLEQFRSACRQPSGAYHLPWDLLVVDEAHNLTPASFGEDSDLCTMLRAISPYFEHKLFLTATPHNGHTRCFTGMLELLDPVRFTQTSELKPAERARVEEVVVRRLKREINELDESLGRVPRFPERFLEPLPLFFSPEERALAAAFADFRAAVRKAVAKRKAAEERAGWFAVEILNKRLLSCPWTFADSWYRFQEGLADEEGADTAEVAAAKRAVDEEVDNDAERQSRERQAARVVGAWLKPLVNDVRDEIDAVTGALTGLGIVPRGETPSDPAQDARFDRLVEFVRQKLRKGKKWVDDERLILFTEYKTTLDYVERRLRQAFGDEAAAIRTLYGEVDFDSREGIKRAFNDPDDPVRVLVATDAAAEGLNLQETARFVLHYEIPWNPSRLEQRNGRLDRHGQARDVTVFHFTSDDDADLIFLRRIVEKVHAIRDDLGSMGEVLDAAFQRRFRDLESTERVTGDLDADTEKAKGRAQVPRRPHDASTRAQAEELSALCKDIDLSDDTLRDTLEVALGIGVGYPRLEGPDARGRMKLVQPPPPAWSAIIDDSLRLPSTSGGAKGPLPGLVFDPKHFIHSVNERPVFRPEKDTTLLHLGHPVFREALTSFARLRYPGQRAQHAASRWTVRRGPVPKGSQALLLVTVEELAVNELREPIHQWIRTLRLPIERGGGLGTPDPYVAPADENERVRRVAPVAEADHKKGVALWDEVADDVPAALSRHAKELTAHVTAALKEAAKIALREEKKRYDERLKEVQATLTQTSLQKIERERDELLKDLRQLKLYAPDTRRAEELLRDLDDEVRRRRLHYEELLQRIRDDRERVLTQLLPRRHELRGAVQVFPVAIEIRLPEVGR